MSTRIAGMGWVTPLGADLDAVYQRIAAGEVGEAKPVTNPETGRVHSCIPVPPKLVEHLGRNPRLRRSSVISYFAVAAAMAALENAGLQVTPDLAHRIAVIFAVTDGGVVYTRKFYDQIVKQGANAASPLLFPETVYNAPASHLAAQLGVDGATYTLVGDSAAGLAAVHLGEQLLDLGEADYCVVVGCEELDWILCEAYRTWRFTRAPLAEGAAALVLAREGRHTIAPTGGVPFFRQRDAAGALEKVLGKLTSNEKPDFAIAGDDATFADRAIASALGYSCPAVAKIPSPKRNFGEMLAAGGLASVIYAALHLEKSDARSALVPVVGLNYQADAALIT